jgi:hypothetical protein
LVAGGHETAHQDDLALGVDTFVIVAVLVLGDDAVAGEDDLAGCLGALREGERAESVRGDRLVVDGQGRRRPGGERDRDVELLAVATVVAGRLEAELAEALLDVGRRRFVARGADAAPVAGIVGQPGDIGGVAILGAVLGGDRRGVGPARDVDVGLAGLALVAVGRKCELLAVGREDREAIESGEPGDALEIAAVAVDRPDVELAPLGIAVIGREEDPLAVGEEIGANEAAPRSVTWRASRAPSGVMSEIQSSSLLGRTMCCARSLR